MKLDRSDKTNLGTARLVAAVVRACQDRGDARLAMQVPPDAKDRFDAMGVADWRVGSVVLRKTL